MIYLVLVVLKLDSATHWGNHYSADKNLGKQLHYPLDSAIHLALVVQMVDSAIHRINLHRAGSVILISVILIRWIVIYPVGSAIQRLNNRDLVNNWCVVDSATVPSPFLTPGPGKFAMF